MLSIAVIGAGLSALACTKNLQNLTKNVEITVFEKSRGVGGRMATKRLGPGEDYQFDHGAQYFTVRDKRFEAAVSEWINHNVVQEWKAKIRVLEDGKVTDTNHPEQQRFVGVKGMNAIPKYLAKDVAIKFDTRIVKIVKQDSSSEHKWVLESEKGEKFGSFDIVLISAPVEQTVPLLEAPASSMAKNASAAKSTPCWCAMLGFERSLDLPFDGAFVHNSGLSWIAKNNSKPGRPSKESWVLHGSEEWSNTHLEETPEQVLELMKTEFVKATGLQITQDNPIRASLAHRWRFAKVPQALQETFLYDTTLRIGVCGDWCGGPRVEGAYLSGLTLADKVFDSHFKNAKY